MIGYLEETAKQRILKNGAHALSFRECLGLILETNPSGQTEGGLAAKILEKPGIGLSAREMENAFFASLEIQGPSHLTDTKGLTSTKRARLLAVFEIARRYSVFRDKIRNAYPADPDSFFCENDENPLGRLCQRSLSRISAELRQESFEWFGFVPYHRHGKLGEFCLVQKGNRSRVHLEASELFAHILVLRPKGFILFHNHPSGIPLPSPEDIRLTRAVQKLATSLGLICFGHWVVCAGTEYFIDPQVAKNMGPKEFGL